MSEFALIDIPGDYDEPKQIGEKEGRNRPQMRLDLEKLEASIFSRLISFGEVSFVSCMACFTSTTTARGAVNAWSSVSTLSARIVNTSKTAKSVAAQSWLVSAMSLVSLNSRR
jgi:hypothetical protein